MAAADDLQRVLEVVAVQPGLGADDQPHPLPRLQLPGPAGLAVVTDELHDVAQGPQHAAAPVGAHWHGEVALAGGDADLADRQVGAQRSGQALHEEARAAAAPAVDRGQVGPQGHRPPVGGHRATAQAPPQLAPQPVVQGLGGAVAQGAVRQVAGQGLAPLLQPSTQQQDGGGVGRRDGGEVGLQRIAQDGVLTDLLVFDEEDRVGHRVAPAHKPRLRQVHAPCVGSDGQAAGAAVVLRRRHHCERLAPGDGLVVAHERHHPQGLGLLHALGPGGGARQVLGRAGGARRLQQHLHRLLGEHALLALGDPVQPGLDLEEAAHRHRGAPVLQGLDLVQAVLPPGSPFPGHPPAAPGAAAAGPPGAGSVQREKRFTRSSWKPRSTL